MAGLLQWPSHWAALLHRWPRVHLMSYFSRITFEGSPLPREWHIIFLTWLTGLSPNWFASTLTMALGHFWKGSTCVLVHELWNMHFHYWEIINFERWLLESIVFLFIGFSWLCPRKLKLNELQYKSGVTQITRVCFRTDENDSFYYVTLGICQRSCISGIYFFIYRNKFLLYGVYLITKIVLHQWKIGKIIFLDSQKQELVAISNSSNPNPSFCRKGKLRL